MERSDLPEDDAPRDGAYPPAPLPPHERTWRHPSEIGAATWVQSEPPLTLGRGLMITTGAIGGLLSLALLWAMLPSPGRGGLASPTVVSSSSNEPTGLLSTARTDFVATTLARVTSTALTTLPQVTASPVQLPATTAAPAVTEATAAELEEPSPVAVAVGDSMVITTAHAVEGRSSVTVRDQNGSRRSVHVLMVDRDLGLAMLAPDAAGLTASYVLGPEPSPGDTVTVMGAAPTTATVVIDDQGRLTLDGWAGRVAEGTPVVNANGELIGMCSHDGNGPLLISVANLAALVPPSKTATPGPWLAVHVTDSAAGPLVDGLDPNGPAAASGMAVGDTITAVDGAVVATIDALKLAVAAHLPGDTITVSVVHADQSAADLTITLGTAPSM